MQLELVRGGQRQAGVLELLQMRHAKVGHADRAGEAAPLALDACPPLLEAELAPYLDEALTNASATGRESQKFILQAKFNFFGKF